MIGTTMRVTAVEIQKEGVIRSLEVAFVGGSGGGVRSPLGCQVAAGCIQNLCMSVGQWGVPQYRRQRAAATSRSHIEGVGR